mmetsp:Transcript_12151/g.28706  ORF Transcript_12151/g.28706 Transcript_12151/m.28706 type:complete len:362 (+) Transcript_12151:290-1375(+)
MPMSSITYLEILGWHHQADGRAWFSRYVFCSSDTRSITRTDFPPFATVLRTLPSHQRSSSKTSISWPSPGIHFEGATLACIGRKRPSSMDFSTILSFPSMKSVYSTSCLPSLETLSTLASAQEYSKPSTAPSTSTAAPILYLPPEGAMFTNLDRMYSSMSVSSSTLASGSHETSLAPRPFHLIRNSVVPPLLTRTSIIASTSRTSSFAAATGRFLDELPPGGVLVAGVLRAGLGNFAAGGAAACFCFLAATGVGGASALRLRGSGLAAASLATDLTAAGLAAAGLTANLTAAGLAAAGLYAAGLAAGLAATGLSAAGLAAGLAAAGWAEGGAAVLVAAGFLADELSLRAALSLLGAEPIVR